MHYRISYCCRSHRGLIRKSNQDNYICDDMICEHVESASSVSGSTEVSRNVLLGIFDGLGGEEKGEEASLIAARTALALPKDGSLRQMLLRFCEEANNSICRYAKKNGVSSMGTTAALLVFSPDEIGLCNIGDSRIYRINNAKMKQLSRDHVFSPVKGMKGPLTQALGIPADELLLEPYLAHGSPEIGDRYLICSDGLTDQLEDFEIESILTKNTVRKAAEELLRTALMRGGRDNITLIVCEVEKVGEGET